MEVIKPKWAAPSHIHAFTTTRMGGFSLSPYDSLNFGLHVKDKQADVLQNRKMLTKQQKIPFEPLWLDQQHTSVVVDADTTYTTPPKADASVSENCNRICAVMTADCLPILLCTREGTQVAAIHAGWRGLANNIVGETLKHFKCNPSEVLVWLGPAISKKAFEVGEDVYEAFMKDNMASETHFTPAGPEKYFFDMYAAARHQFNNLGVTAITGGEYCTYNDKERFYSYRRDGVTGRMVSMIWMSSKS